MEPNDNDPLFTQTVLSRDVLQGKVAEATLEKWRHLGRGPRFIKVGKAVFYRQSAIDHWLKQQTRSFTTNELPDIVPASQTPKKTRQRKKA